MSSPSRMLPATIWQRELVEFLQRRRALVIKLSFPLLIGMPLILGGAPLFSAATALTMLFAVIGAVGSAAVLSRERSTGLALRYRTLPVRPGRLLFERLATNAAIDFLQIVPALILIGIRSPAGFAWWPALILTIAAGLAIGNLLGAVASILSDSPGEVMLFVFVPLLPAFFLSGLFTPFSDPVLLTVSRLLPFSYLHQSLLGALGGHPNLFPWETALGGAGFLVGAGGLIGLFGRRVVEAD